MPRKLAKMGGRRVGRQRVGGSKFTDFFKKTIPSAAKTVFQKAIKPAAKFIKDQKLISKGLSLIPHPGAKAAAVAANIAGLGRRRRPVRRGMGRRQMGGL